MKRVEKRERLNICDGFLGTTILTLVISRGLTALAASYTEILRATGTRIIFLELNTLIL